MRSSLFSESAKLRFIGDNSIANLINQGQELLQASSDSARLDAEILLCFILEKERSFLLTWPENILSDQQFQSYISLLIRRTQGEPVAYIVGTKEFWSLPLKVSTETLIPRPDTETLVELVLEEYGNINNLNCLDLGTGTGAIALALASENPTWHIDAIDYNEKAVKLAQFNANSCKLLQVNIFQSDWFSNIESQNKFDLIVSNPPYIDCEDENLNQGDVRFEPESALVAADNGLADIKHIAKTARSYLNFQGRLFFEHGYEQGLAVRNILLGLGYENVDTRQDLNGHDRITWATFPK